MGGIGETEGDESLPKSLIHRLLTCAFSFLFFSFFLGEFRVEYSYIPVCQSYVLVSYSYVPACTRMFLVCYSYVTRMSLVCHPSGVLVTIGDDMLVPLQWTTTWRPEINENIWNYFCYESNYFFLVSYCKYVRIRINLFSNT